MLTWVETDQHGAEYVVRQGTGQVNHLLGVGTPDKNDPMKFDEYRVEIAIDPPKEKPNALRYHVTPIFSGARQELVDVAAEAIRSRATVDWRIEWTRLAEIPSDVPIGALDFSRHTVATLVELSMRLPDDAGLPSVEASRV